LLKVITSPLEVQHITTHMSYKSNTTPQVI